MGDIGRDDRITPLEPIGLNDLALDEFADANYRHGSAEGVFAGHPLLRVDGGRLAEHHLVYVELDSCSRVFAPQILPDMRRTRSVRGIEPAVVPARDVPTWAVVGGGPLGERTVLKQEFRALYHRHFSCGDGYDLMSHLKRRLVWPKAPVVPYFREKLEKLLAFSLLPIGHLKVLQRTSKERHICTFYRVQL